jgi:hypothetical protein
LIIIHLYSFFWVYIMATRFGAYAKLPVFSYQTFDESTVKFTNIPLYPKEKKEETKDEPKEEAAPVKGIYYLKLWWELCVDDPAAPEDKVAEAKKEEVPAKENVPPTEEKSAAAPSPTEEAPAAPEPPKDVLVEAAKDAPAEDAASMPGDFVADGPNDAAPPADAVPASTEKNDAAVADAPAEPAAETPKVMCDHETLYPITDLTPGFRRCCLACVSD